MRRVVEKMLTSKVELKSVVTSGVFRVDRNPVYRSMMLPSGGSRFARQICLDVNSHSWSASTPGLYEAAAQHVARKRHPLLGEEPRDEVERAPEGPGRRHLAFVPAPLSCEGDKHPGTAGRRELPRNERRRQKSDRAKEEQRRCGDVQGQVEAIAMSLRVERPLPGEKPQLVSTMLVHLYWL